MKELPEVFLGRGDTLTDKNGETYTIPRDGHYTVRGQVISYNGVPLQIDWSGRAKGEPEAVARAIEDMRARLGAGVPR